MPWETPWETPSVTAWVAALPVGGAETLGVARKAGVAQAAEDREVEEEAVARRATGCLAATRVVGHVEEV